ncbi:MAG: hypothetical protein AB1641_24120 [Thermodesulfobacteriota bacterium]
MEEHNAFGEALEAADRLSPEEKEALIEILRRRLIDERREEIIEEIATARKEFQSRQCQPASPEDLMKEILG